jgi:DNA-binding MarR family transcriptional regulator
MNSEHDPGVKPGDLAQGPDPQDIQVAATLRTAIHRLVKLLRRQTRNDAQLSLTERSTLGLLYNEGQLAPSDIARTEKVTTQSVSQVINHLAEAGYIERTPSDDDKRKVLLSLTPAGRAYVEQSRHDKQEWLARALHERTTAEEKEALLKALQILAKLIEE